MSYPNRPSDLSVGRRRRLPEEDGLWRAGVRARRATPGGAGAWPSTRKSVSGAPLFFTRGSLRKVARAAGKLRLRRRLAAGRADLQGEAEELGGGGEEVEAPGRATPHAPDRAGRIRALVGAQLTAIR
jgi:hypothetical protein